MVDDKHRGRVRRRLHDIIDRNRDGKMSAEELQAAIRLPAHAQSISRLIVRCLNEWYYRPPIWDGLDELLGHSGSTPNLNWLAEKERLKQMNWWDEVAAKVGIPTYGKVFHFHPVGLLGHFMGDAQEGVLVCKKCKTMINLTKEFLEEIGDKSVKPAFISAMVEASASLFKRYGVDSCDQMTHLLAQAKVETGGFAKFKENLNYSRRNNTAEGVYELSPSVIDAGFARKGLTFASKAEKLSWIDEHLLGNDAAYGLHCYGRSEHPGKDFRGRGLIHLTHYETYKKCARETGLAIDSNPELLEDNFAVAIETALWFWKGRNIAAIAEDAALSGDAAVRAVTHPINRGLVGLSERQQYKQEITSIFHRHFNNRCSKK
ncbi:glycoside hydrolase family 19 protein [Pseudomonas sp. PCH446]